MTSKEEILKLIYSVIPDEKNQKRIAADLEAGYAATADNLKRREALEAQYLKKLEALRKKATETGDISLKAQAGLATSIENITKKVVEQTAALDKQKTVINAGTQAIEEKRAAGEKEAKAIASQSETKVEAIKKETQAIEEKAKATEKAKAAAPGKTSLSEEDAFKVIQKAISEFPKVKPNIAAVEEAIKRLKVEFGNVGVEANAFRAILNALKKEGEGLKDLGKELERISKTSAQFKKVREETQQQRPLATPTQSLPGIPDKTLLSEVDALLRKIIADLAQISKAGKEIKPGFIGIDESPLSQSIDALQKLKKDLKEGAIDATSARVKFDELADGVRNLAKAQEGARDAAQNTDAEKQQQAIEKYKKQLEQITTLVADLGKEIDSTDTKGEKWAQKDIDRIFRQISADKHRIDSLNEVQAAFNRLAEQTIIKRREKGLEQDSPLYKITPELTKLTKDMEARQRESTEVFVSLVGQRITKIQREAEEFRKATQEIAKEVEKRIEEQQKLSIEEAKKEKLRRDIALRDAANLKLARIKTDESLITTKDDGTVDESRRLAALKKLRADYRADLIASKEKLAKDLRLIDENSAQASIQFQTQTNKRLTDLNTQLANATKELNKGANLFINVDGATKAIKSLQETWDGFKRGQKTVSELAGSFVGLIDVLGPVSKTFFAVASASTLAFNAIENQLKATSELAKIQYGMQDAVEGSHKSIRAFQLGLERLGGFSFGIESAFTTMAQKIQEAGDNASGPAAKAFDFFGIRVVDLNNKIRNQEEILQELARVYKALPDSAEKTRFAKDLFGFFNPGAIAYVLKNFEDLTEEVEKSGTAFKVNEGVVAAYIKSERDLKLAQEELAASLTNNVGPAFIGVNVALTTFVKTLAEASDDPEFVAFIKLIGLAFEQLIDLATILVDWFGNLHTVVAAAGAAFFLFGNRIQLAFASVSASLIEVAALVRQAKLAYDQYTQSVLKAADANAIQGKAAVTAGAQSAASAPKPVVSGGGGSAAGFLVVADLLAIAFNEVAESIEASAERITQSLGRENTAFTRLKDALEQNIISKEEFDRLQKQLADAPPRVQSDPGLGLDLYQAYKETQAIEKDQQEARKRQIKVLEELAKKHLETAGTLRTLQSEYHALTLSLKLLQKEQQIALRAADISEYGSGLDAERRRLEKRLEITEEFADKETEILRKQIRVQQELAKHETNKLQETKAYREADEVGKVLLRQQAETKSAQEVEKIEEQLAARLIEIEQSRSEQRLAIRRAETEEVNKLREQELEYAKVKAEQEIALTEQTAEAEAISYEEAAKRTQKLKREDLDSRTGQAQGEVAGSQGPLAESVKQRKLLEDDLAHLLALQKKQQESAGETAKIRVQVSSDALDEIEAQETKHGKKREEQRAGAVNQERDYLERRIRTVQSGIAKENAILDKQREKILNIEDATQGKQLGKFKGYLNDRLKEIDKEQKAIDRSTEQGKLAYQRLADERKRIQNAQSENTEAGYRKEAEQQKRFEEARLKGAQATEKEIAEAKEKLRQLDLERERLRFEEEQQLREARIKDVERQIAREEALIKKRESQDRLGRAETKVGAGGSVDRLAQQQNQEEELLDKRVRNAQRQLDLEREKRDTLAASLRFHGRINDAIAVESTETMGMIEAQTELNNLKAQQLETERENAIALAEAQSANVDAESGLAQARAELEAQRLRSLGDIRGAEELLKRTALESLDAQIASMQALLDTMIARNGRTTEAINLETALLGKIRERREVESGKSGTGESGGGTTAPRQGVIGIPGGQIENTVEGLKKGIADVTAYAQALIGSAMRGFFDLGAAALAAGNLMQHAVDLQRQLDDKLLEEEKKNYEERNKDAEDHAKRRVEIAKQMNRSLQNAERDLAQSLIDIGRSQREAYENDAEARLEIEKRYAQAKEDFAKEEIETQRKLRIQENRERIAAELELQSKLLAARADAAIRSFNFAIGQIKAEADLRKRSAENVRSLAEAEIKYRDSQLNAQKNRAEYEAAVARGDKATADRLREAMRQDTDALNQNQEQIKALQAERANLAAEREANAAIRKVETGRRQTLSGLAQDLASGKLTKEQYDARVKAANDAADLETSRLKDVLEATKAINSAITEEEKKAAQEDLKNIEQAYADQKKAAEDLLAAELKLIEDQQKEKDRIREEEKEEEDRARGERLSAIEKAYEDEKAAQDKALAEQLASIAEQQAEVYIKYAQTLEEIRINTEEQLDEIGLLYDDFFQSLVDGFANTGDKAKDVAAAIALVMAQLSGTTFKSAEDVKAFLDKFKASASEGSGSGGGGGAQQGGGQGGGGPRSGGQGSGGTTGGAQPGSGSGTGGTGGGTTSVRLSPLAWEIIRLFATGKLTEEQARKELKAKLPAAEYNAAIVQLEKVKAIAKANQPPTVGTTGGGGPTPGTGTGPTPGGTVSGPTGPTPGTGPTPSTGADVEKLKQQQQSELKTDADVANKILAAFEKQGVGDLKGVPKHVKKFVEGAQPILAESIRAMQSGDFNGARILIKDLIQQGEELNKKEKNPWTSVLKVIAVSKDVLAQVDFAEKKYKDTDDQIKKAQEGQGGQSDSGGGDRSNLPGDGGHGPKEDLSGGSPGEPTKKNVVDEILNEEGRDTTYKAAALVDAFSKGKITKEEYDAAYQKLLDGTKGATSMDIKTTVPSMGNAAVAGAGVSSGVGVTSASPMAVGMDASAIGSMIGAEAAKAGSGVDTLVSVLQKGFSAVREATEKQIYTKMARNAGPERLIKR